MNTISDYTIYCTEEQTRKALKLGAPINTFGYGDLGDAEDKILKLNKQCVIERNPDNSIIVSFLPTAEQMIGFLRSKGILFHFDDERNYWNIGDANDDETPLRWYGYSDNKELDAIDAAIEYLVENDLIK